MEPRHEHPPPMALSERVEMCCRDCGMRLHRNTYTWARSETGGWPFPDSAWVIVCRDRLACRFRVKHARDQKSEA